MLSTKELMTVPIRPLVDRTYLEQVLLSRFSHGEVQQWVQKYFQPYRELMSYYRCAIMEVETKFNVLNEELSLQYDRNPIETIKTRLKSPESIMEKLSRRGYPLTVESILSGCITAWFGNCIALNRKAHLPSMTPTAPDVTGRSKRSSRTTTTRATACSPRYHPEGEVSTGASKLGPRD